MSTAPDISVAEVGRIAAGLDAQAAQVAEILAPVPAELLQQDWYKAFERDEQLYNDARATLRALRDALTASGDALRQAAKYLQQCRVAFVNQIHSPSAHDRYADIAERGIEAIEAVLAKETTK
ncbi:MAG: hypothetical protein QM813_17100 [Verrucomicrobiota bacterium]